MNHEKHHGHFEAPREKKRLTGRQKGALGIVLALAVLIGLGVGIYKTVVRPPQKTEPVVETQPEAEEAVAGANGITSGEAEQGTLLLIPV